MKIVGILLFTACSVFTSLSRAQSEHGFTFEPWQDCTRQEQCKTIEPKPWTEREIQLLKKSLARYQKAGLGDFIEVVRKQVHSFQRSKTWYSFGIDPFNPEYETADYIHAITLPDSLNTIIFTDSFFSSQIDPISQKPITDITFLHELAHAYDTELKLSSRPEFYEAAGFKNFHEDLYLPQYTKVATLEIDKLAIQKKYPQSQEGDLLDREFAMEHGLPRTYSMSNPAEAFADLVAFIYFDPTATQYIDSRLIQYIDTHVLSGARDY